MLMSSSTCAISLINSGYTTRIQSDTDVNIVDGVHEQKTFYAYRKGKLVDAGTVTITCAEGDSSCEVVGLCRRLFRPIFEQLVVRAGIRCES
jgi:hypothetical protein